MLILVSNRIKFITVRHVSHFTHLNKLLLFKRFPVFQDRRKFDQISGSNFRGKFDPEIFPYQLYKSGRTGKTYTNVVPEISFTFYMWNGFAAMKLPLIATEYYAYNIVPSVESIKILAIIVKAKMGQNGRRMHNLLLNYLIKLCFIYRLQS